MTTKRLTKFLAVCLLLTTCCILPNWAGAQTLSGTVYRETNNNSIIDSNETRYSNFIIKTFEIDLLSLNVLSSNYPIVTSTLNGYYTVSNLDTSKTYKIELYKPISGANTEQFVTYFLTRGLVASIVNIPLFVEP